MLLVQDLSARSALFRRLWSRHEVRGQSGGEIRFRHPRAGELTLQRERLGIEGAEGQSLVVFHARHGSRDAERLAGLTAGTRDLVDVHA